ncbi:RNA exonuclease 1 homolog [Lemmus lemmus]
MFSADTILIGHSLESDLLALKVIHGRVVDTSVLLPHHLGLPYKRSLRNLMADFLRQMIQDNVDGHSSSEDASPACTLSSGRSQKTPRPSDDSPPAATTTRPLPSYDPGYP